MSCSQHLQHTPDREISWQQAEIFPDPDSGISWTLNLLLAAETKCCAESKKHWQLSQAKVFALPLSVWLRKFMWDFTTEMSAFFGPQSLSIFFLLGSAALAARCSTRSVCWVLRERDTGAEGWHPPKSDTASCRSCSPQGAGRSQAPRQGLHTLRYETPRSVWKTNLRG